jgi:hypothetical protein
MAMAELEAVLAHPWVVRKAGANAEQIAAVAERFGGEVPEGVAQVWRASDGLTFGQFEGELLGASAVLEMLERQQWPKEFSSRGLLPVISDGQSNHVVAHVRKPLMPRLSYLPKDDGPSLVYRGVESLLADLLRGFESGDTADVFLAEITGDYEHDALRTPQDLADAKALLEAGDDESLRGAITLLDAMCLAEWARLLETGHFVRREAKARMAGMAAPEIQALLAADSAAFAAFVELATRAAQQAGEQVGVRRDDALQVGGRWINLDALFYRRNIPDAFERLVAWFAAGARGEDRRSSGYLP